MPQSARRRRWPASVIKLNVEQVEYEARLERARARRNHERAQEESNLQALCSACNTRAGERTSEEE